MPSGEPPFSSFFLLCFYFYGTTRQCERSHFSAPLHWWHYTKKVHTLFLFRVKSQALTFKLGKQETIESRNLITGKNDYGSKKSAHALVSVLSSQQSHFTSYYRHPKVIKCYGLIIGGTRQKSSYTFDVQGQKSTIDLQSITDNIKLCLVTRLVYKTNLVW